MFNFFIAEIYIDRKMGKTWVRMILNGKKKKAPYGMKDLIDVAIDQIIPTEFSGWHRKFSPKPTGELVGKAKVKIPKKFRWEFKPKNKPINITSEIAEAFQIASKLKVV